MVVGVTLKRRLRRVTCATPTTSTSRECAMDQVSIIAMIDSSRAVSFGYLKQDIYVKGK